VRSPSCRPRAVRPPSPPRFGRVAQRCLTLRSSADLHRPAALRSLGYCSLRAAVRWRPLSSNVRHRSKRLAKQLLLRFETVLSIDTTRHSRVVLAFIAAFPDARAYLDRKEQTTSNPAWATNKALRGAIDFTLVRDGVELLAFHDGPGNMWASAEALPLVQSLAEQKVLRFQHASVRPSLFRRLLSCLGLAKSDA